MFYDTARGINYKMQIQFPRCHDWHDKLLPLAELYHLTETEMSSFWQHFVTGCIRSCHLQISVQPATKISSKCQNFCYSVCWIYHRLLLQWRHNGRDGVSNHQPDNCLLNRLFRRRSKKTSKLRITGLWAGNSPGTGEFPTQMASYAENVSIWWRHRVRRLQHRYVNIDGDIFLINITGVLKFALIDIF